MAAGKKAEQYITKESAKLDSEMEKVFKFASENQILLETDTIEETIYEVYEKAASVKGISVLEMKTMVFANFSRIFG